MKCLFPTPMPSALQIHQVFSQGLRGETCLASHTHGLWNIISLSANKSPSGPELFSHRVHGP